MKTESIWYEMIKLIILQNTYERLLLLRSNWIYLLYII